MRSTDKKSERDEILNDTLAKIAKQLSNMGNELLALGNELAGLQSKVTQRREITGEEFKRYAGKQSSKINKTTAMRGALIAIGGEGNTTQWIKECLNIVSHDKKGLAYIPSKLEKREEIIREQNFCKIATDWLEWFSLIKKEKDVFNYVKNKLANDSLIQSKAVGKLLLNYVEKENTFLIHDFLKQYENIAGTEIKEIIRENLPKILSELSAKGVVELIEGGRGGEFIINNKSIARVSIKEG